MCPKLDSSVISHEWIYEKQRFHCLSWLSRNWLKPFKKTADKLFSTAILHSMKIKYRLNRLRKTRLKEETGKLTMWISKQTSVLTKNHASHDEKKEVIQTFFQDLHVNQHIPVTAVTRGHFSGPGDDLSSLKPFPPVRWLKCRVSSWWLSVSARPRIDRMINFILQNKSSNITLANARQG